MGKLVTWSEYNKALFPLIHKFGSEHYTKDKIEKGYFTWRNRALIALEDQVNLAIAFGQPLKLYEPVAPNKHPSRDIYKHEEPKGITDGFLDQFKAQYGVDSVVDLIKKI